MTVTATKGTAEVTLPADDEILITREFDASPELVYEAWTTPELIERWWGCGRGEVTARVDLRVGGSWRYEMRMPDGGEFAFYGEFREIAPGERLVNTEIFDQFPDAVSVITSDFRALDGDRTRLEQRCEYPSREVRDSVIESGMETGMQESMDELEVIAVEMRRAG